MSSMQTKKKPTKIAEGEIGLYKNYKHENTWA